MITMDDKYRFEDFGFDVEPGNTDPMTPVFEHKTKHISGRPGLWGFGSETKEKSFAFPLKIQDVFYDEMQWRFNELVAFLFDAYGKPREIKIVRDYEPDKYYMVKLASQMIPNLSIQEGTVTIPFVAFDPHKYLHVQNHEIHWDSETATFDDSWDIETVSAYDIPITSPQTVETYVNGLALIPTVLITGSGNNVTFSANGKSFSLSNFSNDEIEIRGKGYRVLVNGADDLDFMTGDYLYLMPGLNQVEISGDNLNFTLSIVFQDKYK